MRAPESCDLCHGMSRRVGVVQPPPCAARGCVARVVAPTGQERSRRRLSLQRLAKCSCMVGPSSNHGPSEFGRWYGGSGLSGASGANSAHPPVQRQQLDSAGLGVSKSATSASAAGMFEALRSTQEHSVWTCFGCLGSAGPCSCKWRWGSRGRRIAADLVLGYKRSWTLRCCPKPARTMPIRPARYLGPLALLGPL